MTTDLYTIKDVQNVRNKLLEEQEGKDLLTGLEIPNKQAVLDHSHDNNQYVRAVLHRQSNAALGKIENLYTRYLSYWYPNDLSTFLRQCADYLELEQDDRYRHPGWIKKVQTFFNKLKEADKDKVLVSLGSAKGSNSKDRKDKLKKLINSKSIPYQTFVTVIERVQDESKAVSSN